MDDFKPVSMSLVTHGRRRTVYSRIPFDTVERHEQTSAHKQGQPHEDVTQATVHSSDEREED